MRCDPLHASHLEVAAVEGRETCQQRMSLCVRKWEIQRLGKSMNRPEVSQQRLEAVGFGVLAMVGMYNPLGNGVVVLVNLGRPSEGRFHQ